MRSTLSFFHPVDLSNNQPGIGQFDLEGQSVAPSWQVSLWFSLADAIPDLTNTDQHFSVDAKNGKAGAAGSPAQLPDSPPTAGSAGQNGFASHAAVANPATDGSGFAIVGPGIFNVEAWSGHGGNGGNGGSAGSTHNEASDFGLTYAWPDGGNGGAGGDTGNATALLSGFNVASADGDTINVSAWSWDVMNDAHSYYAGSGGNGGAPDAEEGTELAPLLYDGKGGSGGNGGSTGNAAAESVGTTFNGIADGGLTLNMFSSAGAGGNGGNGGGPHASSEEQANDGTPYGNGGNGGNGGNATSEVLRDTFHLNGINSGEGPDVLYVDIVADPGNGGYGGSAGTDQGTDGNGGNGGSGLVAFTGNTIAGGSDDMNVTVQMFTAVNDTPDGIGLAGSGFGAGVDGTVGTATINFTNNTITGGSGNDLVNVDLQSVGTATIHFSGNVFNGGAGSNILSFAGTSADVSVNLAADKVTIDGGNSKVLNFAHIIGGNGNDTLIGGLSQDTLSAGAGNDALAGGTGTDTFDFSAAPGHRIGQDTIQNFKASGTGHDVIDLHGFGLDWSALQGDMAVDGTGVLITLGTHETIDILNMHTANLSAADFIF